MAGALRVVSVARGYDPREFTLLPFGGAGGLHACALAEKLGMRRILLPVHPGLLSAVGLVLADAVRDYSLSVLRPGDTPMEEISSLIRPLEERARREMAAEGVPEAALQLFRSLDMRYRGQSFEVNVSLVQDFAGAFHQRYQTLYGGCIPERPLEIVTLRLRAVAAGPRPAISGNGAGGEGVPMQQARVVIDGKKRNCPVYARAAFAPAQRVVGPALVTEENATFLVRPGWTGRLDARGNLCLVRGETEQL